MPTAEQLKLMFGAFPVPLGLALLGFGIAWFALRKRARFYDTDTRIGQLDVWALAIAYTVGQHALSGLSGFPPTDPLDWLPFGLIAIAIVATAGASCRLPKAITQGVIVFLALGVVALTLNGFKSYHDTHALSERLAIFAAISLALVAGTVALHAIASKLGLLDFFLLTGIVGTVGAAVLLNGFHTSKLAQVFGIVLAAGGVGFIVGLLSKTKHVSPAFASAWVLIWTVLASNSYLGNYELPPVSALTLMLAMPALAGLGLLVAPEDNRPVLVRIAVYGLSLSAVLIAFALSKPPAEEDDEGESDSDNPYADWG